MKNFDWTQFTNTIAIKADISQLYNAWAVPLELERWFLSDATFLNSEGREIAKSDSIEAGNAYQWQWFLWDTTEMGKVVKANGKDHIQFTFAGDCLVDITFETYHDGTIVTLKQTNIPTDDKSKQDIRLGCYNGWSFYMVNLKSVYEGGHDLRNKDEKLKPMLNN
jgi:uncharacterized protein YndB with AHSA1/START domain